MSARRARSPRYPDESGPRSAAAHGATLALVGIASAVGALASLGFQILAARGLGPAEFGLLAAFFTIVNVAAVGSSALQNSVTVATASQMLQPSAAGSASRWPWEALGIGTAAGLVVAALSPLLASTLATTPEMLLAAAVTVPISFVLADALGLVQGTGAAVTTVAWSTINLIARVALVGAALLLGAALAGVVAGVVLSLLLAALGAAWSARRVPRPRRSVFSAAGASVLILTISFAWLTSADVFFVRANAQPLEAGYYAAVTVLVKASFIVPSTLSLYLLPRLVRHREDRRLMRLGVLVTVALSAATGIGLLGLFAIAGAWVLTLLYGGDYLPAASLLIPVTLAYVPWIIAFGMLIRVTSLASRFGAVALVVGAVIQSVLLALVGADVTAVLVVVGVVGVAVVAVFVVVDARAHRRGALSG